MAWKLIGLLLAVFTVVLSGTADAQSPARSHGRIANRSAGLVLNASYGSYRRCATGRAWIPGHYETRSHRVWVPGGFEHVWVPARYETRYDDCGRAVQVLVCEGYSKRIRRRGRWETQARAVWVPGRWR